MGGVVRYGMVYLVWYDTKRCSVCCISTVLYIASDHLFIVIGNAAFPSAGTTNLHIDMSDAVNVMVR